MKRKFEKPIIEIIKFECEDIITTSCGYSDDFGHKCGDKYHCIENDYHHFTLIN